MRSSKDAAPGPRGALAREVALPGQQFAQHGLARVGDALLELAAGADAGVAARAGLLVHPVRRDAVLGVLVHGAGADLHLQRPAVVGQHHGVQALVAVGLGPRDVVVELALHRSPGLVHAGQRGVARGHVVDDHAQRAGVEDAREGQALALHLLPDAVQVLGPALHVGRQPGRGKQRRELPPRGFDAALALGARLVDLPRHALVLGRLQEAEGQVLQLPLDLPDAQPVGQRREDLQRLGGDHLRARSLVCRVPAQRLQPRRQAQQHHAQVAREGQQHLAHALGLQGALAAVVAVVLLRLARGALDLHQLARQRHQAGVAVAEGLLHHLLGALQVVARVDQVGRRAQRRRAADAAQQRRHAVGMAQRVFAGVQRLPGEQRLGEGARPRHRVDAVAGRLGRAGQMHDGRGTGLAAVPAAPAGGPAAPLFMGRAGTRARRHAARAAPASARGRRRRIRAAGHAGRAASWPARCRATSRSDSAPRSSSVGQVRRS